jgi:hypothetical protein
LAPRAWLPLLQLQSPRFAIGAGVYGFDAVDRHRYAFGLSQDFSVGKPDWFAAYVNRSWAPTLSLFAQNRTSLVATRSDYGSTAGTTGTNPNSLAAYIRTAEASAEASYTFQHTFWAIRPSVAINLQRDFGFETAAPGQPDPLVAMSSAIPSADARIAFSDVENTRLGISAESGRFASLGVRHYLEEGQPLWKGVFSHREHFRLARHVVLTPLLQASAVSRRSRFFTGGNVALRGRAAGSLAGAPATGFDGIGVRGYPGKTFLTSRAALGAVDLRFPLLRVFRGGATLPAFAQNIWGFVFAEGAWLPRSDAQGALGAAGASGSLGAAGTGLKASATVFHRVPLVTSVEYHQGLNRSAGGRGEVFLTLSLGSLF